MRTEETFSDVLSPRRYTRCPSQSGTGKGRGRESRRQGSRAGGGSRKCPGVKTALWLLGHRRASETRLPGRAASGELERDNLWETTAWGIAESG